MSWELSEGGFDDFTATVDRAYFAIDENYNAESMLLVLECSTDLENEQYQEGFRISYSAGKNWETNDGGRTVTHASGRPTNFRKTSKYGKFIARCVNDLGLGETLSKRGDPSDAAVWEGLSFLMKREDIDFGGDIGVKNQLMPVEYLGERASAATARPAANANPKLLGAKVKAVLRAVREEGASYQDFVDRAMEIPGVSNDDELIAQIADEDNGFWATA